MKKKLGIGLIADTHGFLRNEVFGAFEEVDEIFLAGDVGDSAIVTSLEVIAPVQAVCGNVDGGELCPGLPETLELERLGHKIGLIHGHQWRAPKPKGLVTRFADCSIIVYGHSHRPLIEKVGSTVVVNPGSAGRRRFSLPVTVALMTLTDKKAPELKIIEL